MIAHASFVGAPSADTEFPHPQGAALARALEGGLRARSFSVSDFDNWRDVGWAVYGAVNGSRFDVHFSLWRPTASEWLLAVTPAGRGAPDLRALAVAVHEVLAAEPWISGVRWFFGGPPEKVPTYARPEELYASLAAE